MIIIICQCTDHLFQLQELAELTESPPEGITVELADESNVYEWKITMEGPEGSPYHVCQNIIHITPRYLHRLPPRSPPSHLTVQVQQTAFLTPWQTI